MEDVNQTEVEIKEDVQKASSESTTEKEEETKEDSISAELRKKTKLFRNERNWLIVKIIIWGLLFLASISITGVFGYCASIPLQEANSMIPHYSPYYLIPIGILDAVCFSFLIVMIVKTVNWGRIINSIIYGEQHSGNTKNFIKGFYKSSIKWKISLNWFCGYMYFLWLVAILFAFVSSYFTGVYAYGGKMGPSFGMVDWSGFKPPFEGAEPLTSVELVFAKLPLYTLVGGAGVVLFVIIVQVITNVVFNLRKKALTAQFGEIFSYETYNAISAKTNKINFIVYSVLTLVFILTLVLFMVFARKLLGKNKK